MNEIIPYKRSILRPFWEQFSSIEKEFNNLFNEPFFKDAFKFPVSRASSLPKINIREESDKYIVEIAIPGMEKGDVDVKVDDNRLHISGKQVKKKSGENEKSTYIFREIGQRAFHRVIPFPEEIDEEKVNGKYDKGIIYVTIKKKEAKKEKKFKKVKIE